MIYSRNNKLISKKNIFHIEALIVDLLWSRIILINIGIWTYFALISVEVLGRKNLLACNSFKILKCVDSYFFNWYLCWHFFCVTNRKLILKHIFFKKSNFFRLIRHQRYLHFKSTASMEGVYQHPKNVTVMPCHP